MSEIVLDSHQQKAFDAVWAWFVFDSGERQTFSVGGYAGTGKTTLIRHIIDHFQTQGMAVSVAAFTGKAVHVLQGKGVPASTLHRLLYDYVGSEDGEPEFVPKPVGALEEDMDLVIVDEASMVSRDLADVLLEHQIPVLWVGDHGQLEPVGGGSISLVRQPEARLEHVHRQAETSGIIDFAHHLREENNPYAWVFECPGCIGGEGVVCPVHGTDRQRDVQVFEPTEVERVLDEQDFDIVLVGRNAQRIEYNRRLRALSGFDPDGSPQPGEPLVILRNNPRYGLFNGQIVTVVGIVQDDHPGYWTIAFRTDSGLVSEAPFWRSQFHDEELHGRAPFRAVLADYGYVITGHKAQGSEWDRVLVLEDPLFCGPRWRYTAATRASKQLTYIPHSRNFVNAQARQGLVGKMAKNRKKLSARKAAAPSRPLPSKLLRLREKMAQRTKEG